MRIGLVGCGFVADYYVQTLPLHPELELVAVMDRETERGRRLADRAGVRCHDTLEALLDDDIDLVLNLTNPRSHAEVTSTALDAGKHVYSEKPLAMDMDVATELVERAERAGLALASAPCSSLSETAQTMWREIRSGRLGTIRLVYAEMDDGMVHLMPYRSWTSTSGIPWPSKDEFEVGCTIEHAGYVLTWLATWFGPARRVTSFAAGLVPDKIPGVSLDRDAPDFSVACIEFRNGIVARLTCGIVAPHDHRLRVIGDRGVLSTHDTWDYRSRVGFHPFVTIRRKSLVSPIARPIRLRKSPFGQSETKGAQQMDFARGPAELVAALREGRPSALSSRFCLHVNELVLAIESAHGGQAVHEMTTTFEPIEPASWA